MPLKRTTTRALAASVAFVAAGGTVAGAAVFHLPVLGFGLTNAGATASQIATASQVASAKKVAPVRVVKTRFVDQIVHHRAATHVTAGVAPVAGARTSPSAPSAAAFASPTTTPLGDPPDAPEAGGEEGHESEDSHDGDDEADHEEHNGREDHVDDEADTGANIQSGTGAQADQ